MQAMKLVAVILIVLGILALVVGGFSFTKERHQAHIGSMELSVKEKEYVNVPAWAGVGAIVVGTALLLAGKKR
jgi:uncharacterized membrane protein YidH (DUF202 family)